MDTELSLDQWNRISRTLDFILAQKRNAFMYPLKKQQKPKKARDTDVPTNIEQLRLF